MSARPRISATPDDGNTAPASRAKHKRAEIYLKREKERLKQSAGGVRRARRKNW